MTVRSNHSTAKITKLLRRALRGSGALGVVLALAFSLARVHIRLQTTLAGYDIGRLKNEEARLLEERSNLRMQLAKLTTKKHLTLMSETGDQASKRGPNVASRH